MTSVSFPTHLGGSGITVSDDADPNTGLANGGHRERFVPALQGTIDMAQYVYQYAAKIDGAAEDAQRAEDARGYVEAYAGALKRNIRAHYEQLTTQQLGFARGKYAVDDGDQLTETTVPTDLLTVARTSSKWVEGPDGLLREVPADTVAREWRDGEPLGALVEESRTNMMTDSEDLSGWAASNCTVESATAASPIPGVNYQKIVGDSGTFSEAAIRRSYSPETSRTVTSGSIMLKSAGAQCAYIRIGSTFDPFIRSTLYINLLSGESEAAFSDGMTAPHVDVRRMADGSFRVSITGGQDDDNGNLSARIGMCDVLGDRAFTGDGNAGIYATGIQVEEGYMATSYIPTTDTPVTRDADTLRRSHDAVTRGTYFWDGSIPDTAAISNYFLILSSQGNSSGIPSSGWIFWINGSRDLQINTYVDGDQKANIYGSFPDGGRVRVAVSFGGGEAILAVNGSVLGTIDLPIAPEIDNMHFDRSGGGSRPRRVKEAWYLPQILTATELEELTA